MKLTEVKTYYYKGNLNQHYYEDENGLMQGKYRDWWWDGKPWETCNIKNDERYGIGLYYLYYIILFNK